jgi:hypothetical protein
MAFGGFLFAYDGQPPLHMASNDARAALAGAQAPPPSERALIEAGGDRLILPAPW